MAKDEASRGLGIELIDQGEGRAVTRMTVRDDMVNGHAMAHGGLIFTLADTAFACACNSFGPVTVAASADIVFVAPARAGDVLVAEAVLRTRFGRSGLYDVTVRRGGEVIAEFRGRSHSWARPRELAVCLAWCGPPGEIRYRPPRPRRGRPGYDLASAAGRSRRAVQRARLRRHEHAGPGGPARHRQVGHLPPRHGQGGTAPTGPGPGPGRPGVVTGRAARSPRPPSSAWSTWSGAASRCSKPSRPTSPCCSGCAATPTSSGPRSTSGGPSTGSWPSSSPRPCATATSGPTPTR